MGEKLGVYIAEQDNCPYIKGQFRISVALAPLDSNDRLTRYPITPALKNLHGSLIPKGFHQGHLSVAFNNCLYCKACVPLRIAVSDYPFSASNLRVIKALGGTNTKIGKPTFFAEHFALYQKYIADRHPSSISTLENFDVFEKVMSRHDAMVETRNADQKLISVTIYDKVENGISGFSIFYDPALSKASTSLGTYGYLQMISITQSLGLDHLYIGNWVKEGLTIDYKKRYKNLEAMTEKGWVSFDPEKIIRGPDLLPSIPMGIEKKIIQIKPA